MADLSLHHKDFLTSTPHGNFTAGFYPVGDNAYCFAIWYTERLMDGNHTVVWMANRDRPVNRMKSKISITKSGNLVLNDAGQSDIWSTETKTEFPVQLQLFDNGNLVLHSVQKRSTKQSKLIILWQSFDSPTDTLLPQQFFKGNSKLVSSRSLTNHSSGFYQLFFDSDNVLCLLYDGFGITSVFWPAPWLKSWEAGRSTYNSSKIATLYPSGDFVSSDELGFNTTDNGMVIPRRMTLDSDGGLRVYSFDKNRKNWTVSWQASSQPCSIHGICGQNSLCEYVNHSSRKCSCLPAHKMKNQTDRAYGCEPEFSIGCNNGNNLVNQEDYFDFIELNHTEFYGYDIHFQNNKTLQECKQKCLDDCRCRGYQYNSDSNCCPKSILFNGYRSPSFPQRTFMKVPTKANFSSLSSTEVSSGNNHRCESNHVVVLDTNYRNKEHNGRVKSFIWSTCAVGVLEIFCLLTRLRPKETIQCYQKIASRFQKFSYEELKKATRNFSEEIGRGIRGVVC